MKTFREIAVSALVLMVIAGVVTAALAGTNALTKDVIAERTQAIETAARQEVIVADRFDEAVLTTADGDTVTYYIAKQSDGAVVGYVFTATAAGKSAGLTVMTGILSDGSISGVKITEDNETAGYVDKVVKAGFLDELTTHRADREITIGKTIDAVSQATKTSTGVCKGVNQAIAWYQLVKEGNTGE